MMKPVAVLESVEIADFDPNSDHEIICFLFEDEDGEEHEIGIDEMTEEQWQQVYAYGIRAEQIDTLH